MLTLRSEHGDFVIQHKIQDAIFGGVYRSTRGNNDFAVKVIEKGRLRSGINSCENPDAEARFSQIFRGHPGLMSPLFFFEDPRAHYVVMPYARGSDVLEMLKRRPEGFDEPTGRYIFKQVVSAVDYLHGHQVALLDISLENFLLFVNPVSGLFEVKICDPGQAVTFSITQPIEGSSDKASHEEFILPHGLVGKAFRPPEIYTNRAYLATKVDSWCLGWSLFYCLTARQLFNSALETDEDFRVFQRGVVDEILERKDAALSEEAAKLIFSLMKENPNDRWDIKDILHCSEWLKELDTPMSAPMKLIFDERKAACSALDTAERPLSVDAQLPPNVSSKMTSSSQDSPRASPKYSAMHGRQTHDHGLKQDESPVARVSVPRLALSPTIFPAAHRPSTVPKMAATAVPVISSPFTNIFNASLTFTRALEPFHAPSIVDWRR